MKRTMFIVLFLFSLTGCYSYTYVSYDKQGKGNIKTRRGLFAPDPEFINPTVSPRFRRETKPLLQKKGRLRRALRRKKDA
jgi:hypothetical protein